jgi:hypothetical protein
MRIASAAKGDNPMSVQKDSAAVKVARAHVEAWSNHDFDTAQDCLADGVKVTVTTTQGLIPPVDTTGVDDYMVGLRQFAGAVVPGTLKEIAVLGDDHNALLMMTVEADFGGGPTTLPGARLYMIDDDGKITAEQVIFFVGS